MVDSVVQARYRQRLKAKALALYSDLFGPYCHWWEGFCEETENLEFAHLESTGLNGPSRGYITRYFDVLKNPDKYTLLCKKHHKEFDSREEVPF